MIPVVFEERMVIQSPVQEIYTGREEPLHTTQPMDDVEFPENRAAIHENQTLFMDGNAYREKYGIVHEKQTIRDGRQRIFRENASSSIANS